jgi:hypothetical protein
MKKAKKPTKIFWVLGVLLFLVLSGILLYQRTDSRQSASALASSARWKVHQFDNCGLSLEFPFEIHQTIPAMSEDDNKRLDKFYSFIGSDENSRSFVVGIQFEQYKPQTAFSMDENITLITNSMERRKGTEDFRKVHLETTQSGLPAVLTTVSYVSSGSRHNVLMLTASNGRYFWNIMLVFPDIELCEKWADRVLKSVKITPIKL